MMAVDTPHTSCPSNLFLLSQKEIVNLLPISISGNFFAHASVVGCGPMAQNYLTNLPRINRMVFGIQECSVGENWNARFETKKVPRTLVVP